MSCFAFSPPSLQAPVLVSLLSHAEPGLSLRAVCQPCCPAHPSSPLYPCSMSYWFCRLSYKLLCVHPESCFSFFIVLFHKVNQDVTRAPAAERESSHLPPGLPTYPSPALPQLSGCLSHPSCEPA